MVQPRRVRFVQRLPSPVLVGAGAVGILVFGALGVASLGDDDSPPTIGPPASVAPRPLPSPPGGVRPRTVGPDGLGVTLQVPSTWETADGEEGYEVIVESPDGDALVLLDRREIDDAHARVDSLESLGALVASEQTTTLDGYGAQRLRYELPLPGRGIVVAEEVDVDLADGTYAIAVVGQVEGGDADEVLAWIVQTIRVAR